MSIGFSLSALSLYGVSPYESENVCYFFLQCGKFCCNCAYRKVSGAFDLIHSNSSLFYVSAPLARAELEWWVERRKPNTTVDAVAALMEESFKVLYKGEKPAYSRTCFLRASAAYYRDQAQDKWGGVVDQDWKHIESMLALAYQALPMLNSAQHSLSK